MSARDVKQQQTEVTSTKPAKNQQKRSPANSAKTPLATADNNAVNKQKDRKGQIMLKKRALIEFCLSRNVADAKFR